MSDDIYSDILWKLRIPLPYELRGLTVQDLANERKEAADEIERLRLDRQRWRKIAELAREAWNTDSWIVFNNEYLRMVHGDR